MPLPVPHEMPESDEEAFSLPDSVSLQPAADTALDDFPDGDNPTTAYNQADDPNLDPDDLERLRTFSETEIRPSVRAAFRMMVDAPGAKFTSVQLREVITGATDASKRTQLYEMIKRIRESDCAPFLAVIRVADSNSYHYGVRKPRVKVITKRDEVSVPKVVATPVKSVPPPTSAQKPTPSRMSYDTPVDWLSSRSPSAAPPPAPSTELLIQRSTKYLISPTRGETGTPQIEALTNWGLTRDADNGGIFLKGERIYCTPDVAEALAIIATSDEGIAFHDLHSALRQAGHDVTTIRLGQNLSTIQQMLIKIGAVKLYTDCVQLVDEDPARWLQLQRDGNLELVPIPKAKPKNQQPRPSQKEASTPLGEQAIRAFIADFYAQ